MSGVAVVGVHRGGTSALAKVVHGLGAYMGDNLLPPSKHNPEGYYEEKKIVDFHDKVIGGNWRLPSMNQADKYLAEYKVLLGPFVWKDLWAIKDPRLCYCLPLLIKAAPDMKTITIYRDPFNSAKSLAKRNKIPFEIAFMITIRYLAKMIENTVNLENVMSIRYIDLISKTNEVVDSVASFLGVTPKQEAYSAVKPSLAHWELEDNLSLASAYLEDQFKNIFRGMAESG